MISVTWTGAAGLRFETDQSLILVDPYHTRIGIMHTLFKPITPDTAAIGDKLPDIDRVDAVVVGHTHSDHALDVPHIVKHSGAKLVGSSSLEALMARNKMPGRTTVCQGGEVVPLTDTAAVTMIRSTHGRVAMGKVPFPGEIRPAGTLPMKAAGYRVGTTFTPKLDIEGTVFIHNGSADFIEQEVTGHTCDVLFLCVAGWKKRLGYPEQLVDMTRPSTVVMFHYDNFSKPRIQGHKTPRMPLMDMPGMVGKIKAVIPNIRIIIPEVGDVMTF